MARRPPWRVGVSAGLIVIGGVLIVGAILAATMRHPPDPELVGKGAANLAIAVGIGAALIARRRDR